MKIKNQWIKNYNDGVCTAWDNIVQERQSEVSEEDAVLNQEDMTHYENEHVDVDAGQESLFGEAYNEKFLAELQKIKDEKGEDYFRN